MRTPTFTNHARARCAEMGISTKVAKRIFRFADVDRPCCGARLATYSKTPEYAVLYDLDPSGQPVVITVLFNTKDRYVRLGTTFGRPALA